MRTKLVFLTAAVLLPALVLWLRQSDDALLRVDLFPEAMFLVALGAAPALLLYLLVQDRRVVIAEGVLLTVVLTGQWWVSATDWHSTASIGPFFAGWLVLPFLVLVGQVFGRPDDRETGSTGPESRSSGHRP